MEVLYAVCCGLDVHQASVPACLRSPGDGPQRRQEVHTFGITTRELLRLADWLIAAGCTHIAMESTGVYWRPVYNLLEGSFELSVVNAQHVKMVPGQIADMKGLSREGLQNPPFPDVRRVFALSATTQRTIGRPGWPQGGVRWDRGRRRPPDGAAGRRQTSPGGHPRGVSLGRATLRADFSSSRTGRTAAVGAPAPRSGGRGG